MQRLRRNGPALVILARLIVGALLKLAILGSFTWLVLNDHAAWASPLLLVFIATSMEHKAEKPAPAPAKKP